MTCSPFKQSHITLVAKYTDSGHGRDAYSLAVRNNNIIVFVHKRLGLIVSSIIVDAFEGEG